MKTLMKVAIAAVVLAPAPAAAETLTVSGSVAGYCDIRLANVSSGTATIAFTQNQKIANLELACNHGSGTRLVVNPQNGDLINGQYSINYAMEILSPSDGAFAIGPGLVDTAPGDGEGTGLFTRDRPGYSQPVANGIPLELWMNVNVENEGGAPDLNGNPQLPANNAPAGTYVEVFDFTVSSL